RELSERYGLAVDPDARVERTTVGQQQRVEILKALYRGAETLILDEPTAVLTPQEAQELFEILRSLKEQGKSIIFISHKLNEVLEIADRITTLRRGGGVGHIPEDRHRRGLVLPFSLTENLALSSYRHSPNSRLGLLNLRAMLVRARKLLKEFDVRGGTPSTPAFALSGGNQQKVVLAREI